MLFRHQALLPSDSSESCSNMLRPADASSGRSASGYPQFPSRSAVRNGPCRGCFGEVADRRRGAWAHLREQGCGVSEKRTQRRHREQRSPGVVQTPCTAAEAIEPLGGNVPILRSPDLHVLPHQATTGLLCPRPLVSLAHTGLRIPCYVPQGLALQEGSPWLLLSWNANYVCGASQRVLHGTTPVAARPVQGVIVL